MPRVRTGGGGITKGQRTRQRIMEVVVDLLETTSYGEVTIAEITRRAEVTRPAFYFHFPSKGAAVAALLHDLFEEFVATAAAWYEHPSGDALRGVPEALTATVGLWRSNARLMHGMAQAAAVDGEAHQLWQDWMEEFTTRAAHRIRSDFGDHRTTMEQMPSVEAMTELLVAATFDAMRRDVRRYVEEGTYGREVAESLIHLWTRALGSGAPS